MIDSPGRRFPNVETYVLALLDCLTESDIGQATTTYRGLFPLLGLDPDLPFWYADYPDNRSEALKLRGLLGVPQDQELTEHGHILEYDHGFVVTISPKPDASDPGEAPQWAVFYQPESSPENN